MAKINTSLDYDDIVVNLSDSFTVNATGTYSITNASDTSIWKYDTMAPSITWSGDSPTITVDTIDTIDWDSIGANLNNDSSLKVSGNAVIDGDLTVGGKSIMKSLEAIEERLAILKPNEELEERWDELRNLRNKYEQLEKELIEKEKMWSMLKK